MPENSFVFQYAYIPQTCRQFPQDGGFRITYYDGGVCCFEQMDLDGQAMTRCTFQTDPQVSERIRRLIGRSAWWISALQNKRQNWFKPDCQADFVSMIQLENNFFCMEDLPKLMQCPFRQLRGHYSRVMYNLLEDISSVMYRNGLDFTLTTFDWDHQNLIPLEYQQPQVSQNMPQEQIGYGA